MPDPLTTVTTTTPTTALLANWSAFVATMRTEAATLETTVTGDTAAILSTLQTVLVPFEKQLASLASGAVMSAAQKFELFAVAELHAALPAILAAAQAKSGAAIVAVTSEVAALGAKVAVAGVV